MDRKSNLRRSAFSLCAIAAILFCGPAHGQNISSSIGGVVTDTSGAPVSGATITVKNVGTGAVNTAVTDASGTYSVPALLAGTYDLTATKQGFETYTAAGFQLLSAQTARMNVTLHVGNVRQEVTVISQTPMVQTDSMGVSSSITTTQLQNLKNSNRVC